MPGGTPDVNAGGAGTPDIVGPGDGDGGVSDHGELTGLGDDDHTHYLDGTRHDGRDHADVAGVAAWADLVLPSNAPGGADDDELDDGAIDAAWVEVTPTGTATWTEAQDLMSALTSGGAASDVPALVKPFSLSAPVVIEAAVRYYARQTGNGTHGLVFSDGTTDTSNCLVVGFQEASDGQRHIMRGGTFTALDTSLLSEIRDYRGVFPWLHVRMTWVSADTWRAEFSPDGVSWVSLGADQAFTLSPTHFGLASLRGATRSTTSLTSPTSGFRDMGHSVTGLLAAAPLPLRMRRR